MITPDEFIRHINNCINLMVSAIEDETGKSKGRESALSDKNLWPCLMTLNF
jgi:hypothetical protein